MSDHHRVTNEPQRRTSQESKERLTAEVASMRAKVEERAMHVLAERRLAESTMYDLRRTRKSK